MPTSTNDNIFLAHTALSENSWFTRAWTFQEIVLAKIAKIYCGAEHISWDMLATHFNMFAIRLVAEFDRSHAPEHDEVRHRILSKDAKKVGWGRKRPRVALGFHSDTEIIGHGDYRTHATKFSRSGICFDDLMLPPDSTGYR